MEIKFGTDGWRAIIGKDFTTNNVARVSLAVAEFLDKKQSKVVLGYDCRFGGKLFAETAAKVFAVNGVKVFLSSEFVSTPMVSLGVVNYKADLGVVITASHNPPSYNGYKLKGNFGGPLLEDDVLDVQNRIPKEYNLDIEKVSIDELINQEMIEYIDLESQYYHHVQNNFDLDLIKSSSLNLAYDPMFGAGINIMSRIFPDIVQIHNDLNPGFNGMSPEPIHKNLLEFSDLIKSRQDIDVGLATDGDADRLGIYNQKGEFIDSHHLILLLIHYLVKYKKKRGKVVTAFSCTVKINKMCNHYNLDHEIVKIGFKHIAGRMVSEDIMLGGEESGGIAIKEHIPERDGIWMGLILFEFMASSGKTLDELINEVYDIVGRFSCQRLDLHIDDSLKTNIIKNCQENKYTSFGDYQIIQTKKTDGFKYFFDDNTWVMIRPSGTEPVLRIYSEAETYQEAIKILDQVEKTLKS